MGYRMALSFKNNKRDTDLLEVINSKRDKSNFIKDAIEFFIEHEKSIFVKQPSCGSIENLDSVDIETPQVIEKENMNFNAVMTFMQYDEEE